MKLTSKLNYYPHNLDTAELASCYIVTWTDPTNMQYLSVLYWPLA